LIPSLSTWGAIARSSKSAFQLVSYRPGRGILRGVPAPNRRNAMDDKERQIDEMGEAREAQYALECVLARLTEAELQRVIADLPPRAREHIRVTPTHKIRHLGDADLGE
jgi:hypothetical protein